MCEQIFPVDLMSRMGAGVKFSDSVLQSSVINIRDESKQFFIEIPNENI